MIDEFNLDRTGWARFSDDKLRRYRLARVLDPRLTITAPGVFTWTVDGSPVPIRRVVFLLLNPSTATAWKPDPTVTNCTKFGTRWGAHVLEVVNLFAFRSPYPADLRVAIDTGVDATADAEILAACTGAEIVIAAWGNHGNDERLGFRANAVTVQLVDAGIKLHSLGMSKTGAPKHPMARGKHRIPDDQQPVVWP